MNLATDLQILVTVAVFLLAFSTGVLLYFLYKLLVFLLITGLSLTISSLVLNHYEYSLLGVVTLLLVYHNSQTVRDSIRINIKREDPNTENFLMTLVMSLYFGVMIKTGFLKLDFNNFQ
jgi:c-di-AMP phosphodiesterase-like protein